MAGPTVRRQVPHLAGTRSGARLPLRAFPDAPAPRPLAGPREHRALRLRSGMRRRIEALAREEYPHEGCGLLVGPPGNGLASVELVTRARNLAQDRLADRYVLDPLDYLLTDELARREGLEILGIWHSHPDHPARPSSTDRDKAWPGYTYVIVEVREGEVRDLTAWHLDGTEFQPQAIEEDS